MTDNWVLVLPLICLVFVTWLAGYYKKSYLCKLCNLLIDIADTIDYMSTALDDINDRINDIERKI